MLQSLQVRDLAIIETIEITLERGLNVVTGETGAGKSILVDALALALGARGISDLVRTGASHAEVTALFDVRGNEALRVRLEEAGIAWDDGLTARRIVSADKTGSRSRAYLNGRVVSLAQLAQLTAGLADVTSQHEHQSLTDPATHLALLDAVGKLDGLRNDVAIAYAALARASEQLETLLRELRARTDREDLLTHQLREIDDAGLGALDETELVASRERLRHAEKLRAGATEVEELLYGGDGAAAERIAAAHATLGELSRLDISLAPGLELLGTARAQVEEVARMAGRYARGLQSDPERLEQIERTLQSLGRLKRKYGDSIAAIHEFRARAAADLENIAQGESRVASLEREIELARDRAAVAARALSAERHRTATTVGDAISRELTSLGMGGARIIVDVTPCSPSSGELSVDGARLLPSGIDRVEFLIAPNRGEEPRPLRKIASGGELSRALLAVKRVLTAVGSASLYVFDEVDVGVGGAVAEVIGRKLEAVSRDSQVLVITHLPQIAVYADRHLVVDKRESGERTVAHVRALSDKERVDEIARMLGGLKVTERTRATAREMLKAAAAD